MATLIVLDRPSNWHIPYFAMGSRFSFENRATPLDLDTDLAKIVGRRCTDWVRDRQGDGAIRLLATRNYLPPQTTMYAHLLEFREKPLADDFLDAFPRYRLEERLEKLRRERQGLQEKVEQRVRRRGFDLSRVGAEQRRTVAQRFVEAHDKIRDLACYQQDLETATLTLVPPHQRVGPLIIDEEAGRPYAAHAYAREWRAIARAAGVPDHVWNMDARAGGISEGDDAGADLDML